MSTISVNECLSFGWKTFKARPWFFVLLTLIVFVVSVVSSSIQHALITMLGKTAGDPLSFIISLVIDTFIGIGFVSVYLKAHDAVMSPRLADLWYPSPFLRYLGTYLLLMIILVVGFILLVVPGVILAVMFVFATILVVDKGLNPIEALKESARLTKGHRWDLFWLLVATIAVNLVGVIALFVGVFVSIPVTVLAMTHAYRTLSGVAHADVPTYTPEPAPAA